MTQIKLSGLVPLAAIGGVVGSRTIKEAEETCPKCGKPLGQCECMGEDMDKNVANGLPQTQGDSKITLSREHFKNIVREVMKEEEEYQKVFHKMMDKFGISSPADIKDDETKKKFFNAVQGVHGKLKERAAMREAELSAGQKKLDVDGDGEIEGSDLEKLRASKNEAKKKKW